MLIPITFNSPLSPNSKLPTALAKISHDEVVLVELQGTLEVEVAQSTDKNGKFVGKLTVDDSGSGKATLLIGHNLLEGKIVPLPKPLAILTRSTADNNISSTTTTAAATRNPSDSPSENSEDHKDCGEGMMNESNAMECDNSDGDGDGNQRHPVVVAGSHTQWEAVGIVKRKILFAKRPMPIAS